MDDKELERMGQNLNIEDKDEKASIITQDKLKKFNEIYGYEHGPATENQDEEEGMDGDQVSNPNEGEEQRDEVHSLQNKGDLKSQAALKGKLQRN